MYIQSVRETPTRSLAVGNKGRIQYRYPKERIAAIAIQ